MTILSSQFETFVRALAIDLGHLGLVVVNGDPKKLSLPGLAQDAVVVNLDAKSDAESALAALMDCAKQGKWLRLNLALGTFSGRLYNQLRNISTMGRVQAGQVGSAGELIELRWPQEAKIVVVATDAIIENIAIPTFLNLFGPIVREG
jgi:hypothetical protein